MEAVIIIPTTNGATMGTEKTGRKEEIDAHSIVFGFDRATDEKSLRLFLHCFTDKTLMDALLPRLDDEDIFATVDFLTRIMQKHLSEKEYHSLFLAE
jgi:hypothetical protein